MSPVTKEHTGRLKKLSRIWGEVLKLSQHKTSSSKDLNCNRNESFPSPGDPPPYLMCVFSVGEFLAGIWRC